MSGLVTAIKFVFKWTVIGLAIACVILLSQPERWRKADVSPENPPRAAHEVQTLSFADAVARSSPAVVNIYTARVVTEQAPNPALSNSFGNQWPSLRQRVQNSLGSGVIVDDAGHVVTNNHVVQCADQIWLQLADGRSQAATVVGADKDTDIAVLKIDLTHLPVMPLGRSDELRIGDVVLAIGNPYGLSQTVTQGIVSARGRGDLSQTPFENYIQTDAAINVGNSGGALINAKGELVGINTAVLAQELRAEGIGFAIPVNLVRGVLQQIVQYGRVKRGWFGVEWPVDLQDVAPQVRAQYGITADSGILVVQVTPDSPAARAGVMPGDIIKAINGKPRTAREALNLVARTPPGQGIQLTVLRNGQEQEIKAILVERTVAIDCSKERSSG